MSTNLTEIEAIPQRCTGSARRISRTDRVRRMLAAFALAMTLPYVALKIAWLGGSRIGLQDASFGTGLGMHVLNAATLALDVVAAFLAVVFFTGRRPPAVVVTAPMWVGYGLLGQILLLIGPSIALQSTSSTSGHAEPIASWVYAAVYAGFCGIGLGLLPAFALYARDRWGTTWSVPIGMLPGGRRAPMTRVAVGTVSLVLLAVAAGAESLRAALDPAADAVLGGCALLAMTAVATGRPGHRLPAWVPLLVLWFCSGAWAAWGSYEVVLAVIPNDLTSGGIQPVSVLTSIAKVACAVLLVRSLGSAVARWRRPE